MARQTIFCKHFQSMAEHDKCKAGVCYDKLKGIPFKERPCFMNGKTLKAPGGCDLAEFPTKEEIEAQEVEDAKRFENTMKAREAIVATLGPYKKGEKGAHGSIDCPCCKVDDGKGNMIPGKLSFSRAGYNGHIHARCSTENCVAWME